MENHIISVRFNGKRSAIVPSKYYHDYKQVLRCEDIELPDTWELHIANNKSAAKAQVVLGNESGAEIPSSYFKSGEAIYCWIFLHDTEHDGETVYQIKIPINSRPEPDYEEPIDPEEESLITQAIAALNNAIERTAQDVISANSAKEDAEEAALNAEESMRGAIANAQSAANSASDAQTSSENAALSETTARGYSESAAQSAANAYESAERAEQAAATSGFMEFSIENGHIIYVRTSNVEVVFDLSEDGHIVIIGE